MSTELALFSVAKEALAELVRVDEIKDVRDKAERIRLYGQQAKDRSIIADATEVVLRAERRLGELLLNAHETGQLGIGRPARSNVVEDDAGDDDGDQDFEEAPAEPVPQRVTLKEAGIDKKLSARSQQFAAVDETAFEAAIQKARDKILSGGAVVVNPIKDLTTAEKKARRAAREIELGAKQMALPEAKFGVILTDDEWDYETWSEEGMDRSAANHYPVSSLDELKKRDVLSLAAPDSVHWLWTTAPHLAQGIELMAHRGFEYKTCVIWEKEYAGERHGMGRWFWVNHEILLLGTRGNVPAPAPGTQWPSIIKAPVGEHSAKPDVFYELIEAYFPTLPKIELNARRARPGWVRWGYEAPEENAPATANETQHPVSRAPSEWPATVSRSGGDDSMVRGARTEATAVTDGETSPPAGADTGTSDEGTATLVETELARPANAAGQGSVTAGETAPLCLDDADAIIRKGDADKTPLADLAIAVGRPGNINYVKNRRRVMGLSSRDRQREAVAEANRRRADK